VQQKPVQQQPVQQEPVQQQPVQQQPAPQPTAVPVVQEPPAPKPEPTAVPKPAVATIPSLVGLGENQARAVLANLGITNVVADYQGADRLGDLFNQFAPYVVVSHSPGPGTPVSPGMSVALGVRAP
jgi:hypothetical protein